MIVWERLPPAKSSIPDLLEFCSLVKTLVQFLLIKVFNDHPIKTEAFEEYLESMRQEFPADSDSGVLDSLRYLGEIPRSCSLFVLEPVQDGTAEVFRSYGFGPLRIR